MRACSTLPLNPARRRWVLCFVPLLLLIVSSSQLRAQGPPQTPPGLSPADPKLAGVLADLAQAGNFSPKPVQDAIDAGAMQVDAQGRVQVYIETTGHPDLNQIGGAGATTELTQGDLVQARVPPQALNGLARLPFVRVIRLPDYAIPNVGSVTTQGDTVLQSANVRSSYGVNGSGIRIGVISDGIYGIFATGCTTCGATGATPSPINTGDLPNATGTRNSSGILTSTSGGITAKSFRADGNLESGFNGGHGAEGGAMMEIAYDVAPGAKLYFANFSTSAEFANAVAWITANTDVAMSDVAFFGLPYNGTSTPSLSISNGLNNTSNPVRAYFQSAGNSARQHWGGSWLASSTSGSSLVGVSGTVQQFSSNGTTNDLLGLGTQPYDVVQLANGQTTYIYLVWNDPWGASANNYDLFLRQKSTGQVVASSRTIQSGSQNPAETIVYKNNTGITDQFEIVILNVNNAAKPVTFSMFVLGPKLPNSSQTHNYNTVAGSVAAVPDTGGSPAKMISLGAMCYNCSTIESYSSNGPTADGRMKPDATGVDGVSVTGAGGFPTPIWGTSAAAPHGAGIAALLMQLSPCMQAGSTGALAAGTARTALQNAVLTNAVDKGPGGADNTYGTGLIDALNSANTLIPTANAGTNQTVTTTGTSASVKLNGTASKDPEGCVLTYKWTGSCGNAAGASPTVSCPVGTDTETLTVSNNGITFSQPSTVTITVSSGTGGGGTAPTVTTTAASSISSSGGTLNGSVNANGLATNAWFEWGTSSTLSTFTQTATQSAGSGTTAVNIGTALTGLSPSTTYYYRVAGSNSAGTTKGSILSFTTSAASTGTAPAVTTAAATSVTSSGGTLNGSVNPNGAATTAWFEWGTSSTLSTFTQTTAQSAGSGTTASNISAALTGLTASTTYYYRAAASNSAGTTKGSILSFTTSAGTTSSTLALSTTSLVFPATTVGTTSSALPVNLKNTGTTTVTFGTQGVTGPFKISWSGCTTTLSPGANCNIYVVYKPTAVGTQTGTLTINDSDPSSPQIVSLTGTGQ